ncbi:MAG: glutaminyl-peptide cyclotransferase [Planctomycetota bacterium]|jgi:glutaminyl-peptide cyclotransferase
MPRFPSLITSLSASSLMGIFLLGACAGGTDGAARSQPETPSAVARKIHPAPPFDAARAWADLVHLVSLGPRHSASPAMQQQLAFLTAELAAVGLEAETETFTSDVPVMEYTPSGKLEFTNLWADLMPAGADENTPVVIVASHMDTKLLGPNFQGANDGGSSTAALLELARGLAQGPERAVAYRFLFLDGEEAVDPMIWQYPDNTYGSRYHAKEITKRPNESRFKAMVLLDLVGDKDLVLSKDLNSTRWLQDLFAQEGTKAGHGSLFWNDRSMPIKDDHLSFKEELRIPVLDLIDFEFGPNNAYWHTDDDTLANCSQASLLKIGEATLAGLVALEKRLTEQ